MAEDFIKLIKQKYVKKPFIETLNLRDEESHINLDKTKKSDEPTVLDDGTIVKPILKTPESKSNISQSKPIVHKSQPKSVTFDRMNKIKIFPIFDDGEDMEEINTSMKKTNLDNTSLIYDKTSFDKWVNGSDKETDDKETDDKEINHSNKEINHSNEETNGLTDDQLFEMFIPEFNDYLDENNNNIPMIALQYGREHLGVKLFATGIFDANQENNNGKTIFHIAIDRKLIDFCIQLISIYGYNKLGGKFINRHISELCLTLPEYRPLLPYLLRSKCKKETPVKLEVYEKSFFKISKNSEGKGSYGSVYAASGKDGKLYAIKKPRNKVRDTYINPDLFKEMMVSRLINKMYPKTTIEVYGYCPEISSLVVEYLPLTLHKIIQAYNGIQIEYKRDFMIELFKSIIENTANINACGFCHFDLKPANIMVDEKCHVRIIDLGLCGFIGIEKIKLKDFLQSWQVKGPDDPTEIVKYYHNDIEIFIKEKEESYAVNYSTDMYAIASILFGMIMDSTTPIQLLILKEKAYYYIKTSLLEVDVFPVTAEIRNKIDKFSPHLWDFFVRIFTTNSNVRMTCNQALKHPLFTGNLHSYKTELPYSISEIRVPKHFNEYILPEEELMMKTSSLTFLEEFSRTYSNIIIKKTVRDGVNANNYSKEIIDDFVENQDVVEQLLNYFIYESQMISDIPDDVSEKYADCIKVCLSNGNDEGAHLSKDVIENIMDKDITFIPFKSIIVGMVCLLRINGENPEIIAKFLEKLFSELVRKIGNPIEEDFSLNLFMLKTFASLT